MQSSPWTLRHNFQTNKRLAFDAYGFPHPLSGTAVTDEGKQILFKRVNTSSTGLSETVTRSK